MCNGIKRGDIYYADLSPVVGSEQGGVRPVLVVQNNVGNLHSPTVLVAPITSKMNKTKMPTHIYLDPRKSGLTSNSIAMMEQIRVLDKSRLASKIGHCNQDVMDKTDRALAISFGMNVTFARS